MIASARAFALVFAFSIAAHAQTDPPAPPDTGRSWVGTSAWVLANAFPDPPHFYYLEAGHSFTPHNALVVGAVTWTYPAPIGIPYGGSHGDPKEKYPGIVRSFGLQVGWRYSIYKGFNASIHAFHFLQRYEEDGRPARTGYQLFLQGRIGWRWPSNARGLWIEPSIAFNWWPIETNRPATFRARDDRWPNYFLLEPWLNFGWSW